MKRSSAIAIAITGPIMIRISTDMYHHCGPRVAFCAATVSGMVCDLELERNSANKYSFQAKTRTKRKVATNPGTANGSTIDQKVRKWDAPSIAALSSNSLGIDSK